MINNDITKNYLREVSKEDNLLLYKWINDINVRENSFSSDKISFQDHCNWFKASLKNKNRFHYILENKQFLPLGQIRFDVNQINKEILIDISIDSYFRGRGLGKQILRKGLKKIKNELKDSYIFVAEIKKKNISSVKIFSNIGFKQKKDDLEKDYLKMIFKN